MNVDFTSNREAVEDDLEAAIARALEECGLVAEGYAKKAVPVDTGRLRNDISHKVSGNSAYIGTNTEYAAYVELGTGKFYEGGRQDPWVYQDEHGNWHRTNGVKPRPFLKPAVADHAQTYRAIIDEELAGK